MQDKRALGHFREREDEIGKKVPCNRLIAAPACDRKRDLEDSKVELSL